MQRWWLVVAGIGGVALAVLLVPRPDTGGDIPDRKVGPVDVQEPIRRSDEGLVTLGERRAPVEADDAEPDEAVEPVTAGPLPADGVISRRPNPKAAAMAARRDVPEVRYAGKALAPWTQVRRLLASKGDDEPELLALREQADAMTKDLRLMLRDPTRVDWEGFEAAQGKLVKDIRASDYHDPEIEKMLGLVDERMVEYKADAADE